MKKQNGKPTLCWVQQVGTPGYFCVRMFKDKRIVSTHTTKVEADSAAAVINAQGFAVEPTTAEVIEQSKALNYATDKALLASVRKFTKGRVTIRKLDGEYRLRLDGEPKSDYFTSDRVDAYNSTIAMHEHVVGVR